MRQRKLNSDLLIVLDKSEEVSRVNFDKIIPESCESTPVSPHIQFNQGVPIFLNTNMSMPMNQGCHLPGAGDVLLQAKDGLIADIIR